MKLQTLVLMILATSTLHAQEAPPPFNLQNYVEHRFLVTLSSAGPPWESVAERFTANPATLPSSSASAGQQTDASTWLKNVISENVLSQSATPIWQPLISAQYNALATTIVYRGRSVIYMDHGVSLMITVPNADPNSRFTSKEAVGDLIRNLAVDLLNLPAESRGDLHLRIHSAGDEGSKVWFGTLTSQLPHDPTASGSEWYQEIKCWSDGAFVFFEVPALKHGRPRAGMRFIHS